jgi:hypothetical protein
MSRMRSLGKSRESHCPINRVDGALSLWSLRITLINIELLLWKRGFLLLKL